MGVNKFIYGGETMFDLTGDSVTADKLLSGVTAHDKAGESVVGTCTFDVDSTDGTATVSEILNGKSAYARGAKLNGTMPNNGAVSETIATVDGEVAIAQGYHDGGGKVALDEVEKAKLVPNNIKQGIVLFGVEGTCDASGDVTVCAKTVTPSLVEQVVLPDEDADYLSQVTVAAIPYIENENAAGGITITIAG
ncbi:MAG: hypothetical protein R3Y53_00790 [Bacillota bacterium]